MSYDAKTFQDKVNSTFSVTDKQARVIMTSLNGDQRDTILGGGQSSYSLTWVAGKIELQNPAMQSLDAATVQTNGYYNKTGLSAMRLQSVTESTSLYALVNGQIASKNLDVSEKMELGGMYAVRAYPEGETYADQGYVINLEARAQLPKLFELLSGQMQLIGFLDSGTVTTNKNPWTLEQNSRTLSGTGVGLNWMRTNSFVLKTYYAHKLGDAAATSAPDKSGRFWVQAVKYF
jgi:hemolysin activation/secretion protein